MLATKSHLLETKKYKILFYFCRLYVVTSELVNFDIFCRPVKYWQIIIHGIQI